MTHWLHALHVAFRPKRKNLIIAVLASMAFLFGVVVRSYASETLRMFHPGSLMGRVDMKGFQLTLLGVFTLVNVGLVVAGIYGLMSFSVTQRTPEIERRLASGAKTSEVLKLILWHGMQLSGFGVVIGLGAAFLLARWIKVLLFGVEPADPLLFIGVAVVLSAVAFLATFKPARRTAQMLPLAVRSK